MGGCKNIKGLIVIFFTIVAFSDLFANNEADKLNKLIKKNLYVNPQKSKYYCFKLLKVTDSEKHVESRVLTYCYLSYLSDVLDQTDSVFYYYDKGINEAQKAKNKNLEKIVKVNKAKYFLDQFDYDSALSLFNECIEISKNFNDTNTLNYILLQKAGILYELERYSDALKIYESSLLNPPQKKDVFLDLKLGLIKTYLKTDKIELAHKHIIESLKEARKFDFKEFELFLLEQLATYYSINTDFESAERRLIEALQIAKTTQNEFLITHVNINLSRIYFNKKDFRKSIEILEDILIRNKEKLSIEYLSEIYYLLGESYKQVDDITKTNYYFDLFIKSSQKIGQKKIETLDHIHKINAQEIQSEERRKNTYKWIILIVSSFTILILILYIVKKKKEEKVEQSKFEQLLFEIQKLEEKNNLLQSKDHQSIKDEIANIAIDTEVVDDKSDQFFKENFEGLNSMQTETEIEIEGVVIKSETVDSILDKLVKLEEKKLFLRQDFTLHNVAKRLKTNTAYLSKIINSELGKSFSTYVNELRINYIVLELKNNAKLRSYSVQGIANEIGYKSSESFTKYFKNATGISPTSYIKNINELNRKKETELDLSA